MFVHYPYAFLSLRLSNNAGPPTPLGLQILNITDLDNISEVSEVFDSSDDYVGGFPSYLNEDLLILSDYSKGVKFFDFSDPINPTLINTYYDGGEANGIKVVNDYLFVVDGLDGLEILDFTDLNNIREIGSFSIGNYMARIDIVASNNLVYLGGVQSGIKVIQYSIDSEAKKSPAIGILIGFLIPMVILVYRKKNKS